MERQEVTKCRNFRLFAGMLAISLVVAAGCATVHDTSTTAAASTRVGMGERRVIISCALTNGNSITVELVTESGTRLVCKNLYKHGLLERYTYLQTFGETEAFSVLLLEKKGDMTLRHALLLYPGLTQGPGAAGVEIKLNVDDSLLSE